MTTVVVFGAGTMARLHVKAWLRLGYDVLISSPEGAEELARKTRASVAATPDLALRQATIADICTPTASHFDLITASLRAGLDVICEKPVVLEPSQCREVLRLSRETGRRVFPAHVVRYFPQYWNAKQTVDSGRLGEVAVLRFARAGAMPVAEWFSEDEQSGGIIFDQMIHDIDQAIWIAGPVRSVYAAVHKMDSDSDRLAPQVAHVTLTHTSGAISYCRGYWGRPGTPFTYSFHISGTGGKLVFDSRENPGFRFTSTDETAPEHGGIVPNFALFDSPYEAELKDFAWAIDNNVSARCELPDGCAAILVARAAAESALGGSAVTIPERNDDE